VHVPFSVYLGWVTIATIANISVTLVSVGWDGFGISLQTWAILVLALAVILDLAVIATRRDIAYSFVFIWALVGIGVNQAANPSIVLVSEIAVVIIAVALVITIAFTRFRKK
jgi:benzodiazapine receptor